MHILTRMIWPVTSGCIPPITKPLMSWIIYHNQCPCARHRRIEMSCLINFLITYALVYLIMRGIKGSRLKQSNTHPGYQTSRPRGSKLSVSIMPWFILYNVWKKNQKRPLSYPYILKIYIIFQVYDQKNIIDQEQYIY